MISNKLIKNLLLYEKIMMRSSFSTKFGGKYPIISCKRSKFDYFEGQILDKLQEIPLASKGWTSRKSVGDYFKVNPSNDFDCPTFPFEGTDLDKKLINDLRSNGIQFATSFQREAIDSILSGKHVMMSAETGCGKTVAYLLPIIHRLAHSNPQLDHSESEFNSPKALILVPNRELANQIASEAESYAASIGLNIISVVGGQTKKKMLNPQFNEVDILVSTPGVIKKLSSVGLYKLDKVQFTVLDECDTLLDDSFEDLMSSLIRRVSQSQHILVSATVPKRLPPFIEPFQSNMAYVKSPRIHRPWLNVTQKFMRLSKSSKPSHLLAIAKQSKDPLLIFSNKNETSNWVALFLRDNGINCANINGDMNHAIRINQWNNFFRGNVNILSATDIASRGLNTVYVKQVLNYDFPMYASDYIHRSGRIGRFGSPEGGKVTHFVSGEREVKLVQQIEMAIRQNSELPNVDGNITNILHNYIHKRVRDSM